MVRPSVSTEVILGTAAEVLSEHGSQRTTMDDIAAHAGVAKGVLYLRFDGKDDLVRAVIDREMGLALDVTRAAVTEDPRGGLLSRLFVHSLTALRSRPFLTALYRRPRGGAGPRSASPDLYRARLGFGVQFLDDMRRAGMLRQDLDTASLAANLAVWNVGLVQTAPHEDVDALILSMGTLIARSADADVEDTTPGKRCFARLADRLAAVWRRP